MKRFESSVAFRALDRPVRSGAGQELECVIGSDPTLALETPEVASHSHSDDAASESVERVDEVGIFLEHDIVEVSEADEADQTDQ